MMVFTSKGKVSSWRTKAAFMLAILGSLVASVCPAASTSALLPPLKTATVNWSAPANVTVSGYNLYYGGVSGTYTNALGPLTAASATISNLLVGATYYFSVTTLDKNGFESPFSGEVAYTPSATATPAPARLQLAMTPSKQVVLSGTAPAGYTYDIQSSQGLAAWTKVASITIGASGTFQFTNSSPGTNRVGFFRLRQTSP